MRARLFCAFVICLFAAATGARAQSNQLDDAKTLYDSASFDEALQLLDNLGRTQPERLRDRRRRYRTLRHSLGSDSHESDSGPCA